MSKYNKLVPELRFPEFENEGEWKRSKLDSLLDYLQPTPFLVSSTDYNDEYPTPVLTAGKSFILGYTDEKDGIFTDNLPVIIFDDFTTSTQFVDFPFKVKSSALKILLAKKDVNIKFVFESMQMISFQVGVHKRHWISTFSKLKTAVPTSKEQQIIASTLSSLDEIIEAENQKLDLLKEHKTGLMQNLFPRKGKKVPKVRFKEFEKDGVWENKRISEVFNSFSGGTPSTTNKSFYDGNIPFIRSAEINKENTVLFLTEEGLKNSSAKLVKKGDLLVAMYGANSGNSSISRIDGAINQAILCLQSDFSNEFVNFYLTDRKDEIISKYIQGGQGNLSGDTIRSISVPFPKRKIEQQKIASFLSNFDEMIHAQSERITELEEHKKGLMQGLFPKVKD